MQFCSSSDEFATAISDSKFRHAAYAFLTSDLQMIRILRVQIFKNLKNCVSCVGIITPAVPCASTDESTKYLKNVRFYKQQAVLSFLVESQV